MTKLSSNLFTVHVSLPRFIRTASDSCLLISWFKKFSIWISSKLDSKSEKILAWFHGLQLAYSPHVRGSKMDSGFHSIDSGLQLLDSWLLDTRFQSLAHPGFQSPGFWIPKAKLPGFRIPQVKFYRIPESGFPCMLMVISDPVSFQTCRFFFTCHATLLAAWREKTKNGYDNILKNKYLI